MLKQELNTVLAALRYYQKQGLGDPHMRPDEIHDIATDGDEISMDDASIDKLCERLNAGQGSFEVMTYNADGTFAGPWVEGCLVNWSEGLHIVLGDSSKSDPPSITVERRVNGWCLCIAGNGGGDANLVVYAADGDEGLNVVVADYRKVSVGAHESPNPVDVIPAAKE